uniref:Uncharacterized protein n=1 Tax=Parascaris univalens TaxID=6257 RepID=A0A915AUL7_PARUN
MESAVEHLRLYGIIRSGVMDILLQMLIGGIIFSMTIVLTSQCCSKRKKRSIKVVIIESPSHKEATDVDSKKKITSTKPIVKKIEKTEKSNKKIKSSIVNKKNKENKREKKVDDRNEKNFEEEKTVIEKMAKAMGNVFRKKKNDAAHVDEKATNEAKDECISLKKIQILGNLDTIIEKRRAQMEKEIESMRSEHEMERTEKNEKIAQNKHVIITENKCQLYETNDEPTLDEEIEQAELLMLREDL